MGINKTPDELGHQSSQNGYDSIYKSNTYRDYIFNKRPTNTKTKRLVIFLSIDLIALFIVLGIIKRLSDAKEIVALIVGVWYLAARAIIIWIKILDFMGKNHDNIKSGWQVIKAAFKKNGKKKEE